MLNFAVRSGTGLEVWNIQNKDAAPAERQFKPFFKDTKPARAMCFSENFFAIGSQVDGVKVYNAKMELKFAIPARTKPFVIKFSPKETYVIVYEIFTSNKENSDNPNLFIYETATGVEKSSFVMKRHSEWEPFFAQDESFFAIMINGEVNFYENFNKSQMKLGGKIGAFSVSPGKTSYIACYLRGNKGSPSMARLFKFPNLDTPVASKSFSQADKVEMMWNKKGTGCLILTSMDVDSTGVSYYGKQALHFLATNGDSYSVPLSAEGPIHAVSWNPKSTQFIVVYGYVPTKATLFNLKCDAIFDFGTGVRNSIYFNDFGTMVLLGGFGNLNGHIEVWDLVKKKQVSTSAAADTTLLQWSPSGDLYFTATTAPRLRQGNGFKIWHYSGALLYELIWPEKQELLELSWQKYPEGVFKENEISYDKVEGIQSAQKQASVKKYVPPNIRFGGDDTGSTAVPPAQGPIPGLPPGYQSSKNQAAAKGKNTNSKKPQTTGAATPVSTPADDDRKKASAIKKKLKDIRILKEKQEAGDKLDKNQLTKIASEAELNKELAALKL